MNKERFKSILIEASKLGAAAAMLAVAFFSVSYPDSGNGYDVKDEESLSRLSPPEKKLAEKLLSFGLKVSHEKRQIKLDHGVMTRRKIKHRDELKKKTTTAPDFYFHHDGVDCFLEVGSHRQNAHKREQEAVAREATTFKNGKKLLYVQLFHDDIEHICAQINGADELINYLYAHSSAIFYSSVPSV